MTIRELMDRLATMDPAAQVVVWDLGEGGTVNAEVEDQGNGTVVIQPGQPRWIEDIEKDGMAGRNRNCQLFDNPYLNSILPDSHKAWARGWLRADAQHARPGRS